MNTVINYVLLSEDDFIFVYDELCDTHHIVFDLDENLLVTHKVSETGWIYNIDLLQYKRPTSMKGKKYELDNYGWTYVRQMFS